jgi:hypothetical protein
MRSVLQYYCSKIRGERSDEAADLANRIVRADIHGTMQINMYINYLILRHLASQLSQPSQRRSVLLNRKQKLGLLPRRY